jgi:lipoyl(octanoyl) transferase
MRRLTDTRDAGTPDALWLLEHEPVFTLGQAGRREHVEGPGLAGPGSIPVVATDRGGQVTYHGPGQLVAYLMLDLRRSRIGVKGLVALLEAAVIEVLGGYGVHAATRAGAPGVYVADAKIASLGLRVRNGCTYHGLSLNIDMDLSPFARINPCGYPGLAVTQLRDLAPEADLSSARPRLARCLAESLGLELVWDGAAGPVAQGWGAEGGGPGGQP